jgi:hypothetical protein
MLMAATVVIGISLAKRQFNSKAPYVAQASSARLRGKT